jgi:hypothetical protein
VVSVPFLTLSDLVPLPEGSGYGIDEVRERGRSRSRFGGSIVHSTCFVFPPVVLIKLKARFVLVMVRVTDTVFAELHVSLELTYLGGRYGVIVRVRPVFEGSVIVFTDIATSVTVDTMVFAKISLYLSEICTFDNCIGIVFSDGGSRSHCLLRFDDIEHPLSIIQQDRPNTGSHPTVGNRTKISRGSVHGRYQVDSCCPD